MIPDYNVWLKGVLNGIKNDTVLVLWSDHGTMNNGKHGSDEVPNQTGILFLYAPGLEIYYRSSYDVNDFDQRIYGINHCAVMSAAAGLKTPFLNLGHLLPEALFYEDSVPEQERHKDAMLQIMMNLL